MPQKRESASQREIARAKALRARVKPFDEWKAEAPRSAEDERMYHRIVEELDAMIREER